MKRTNCQTDEIEVERKKIKVKGKLKPQETRTKKTVCDLVEEATEKPDQICINKEAFNGILDQIQNILEEPPLTEESHRERLTRVFGKIWSDQIALSKGLAEKKKPVKSKCKKSGNPWHSKKNGRFHNPIDADGSFSRWTDCKADGRSRSPAGTRKRLAIPDPSNCGRSARENGENIKCSTGKKANENMISEELKLRWKELLQN
jgi:hypothetical protein